MNDPEVTMQEPLPSPLDVDRLALEAATLILATVRGTPKRMSWVADQLARAACSVALNLSEGHGRAGGDRIHHYRIAYGSSKEATTALQLLIPSGCVRETTALEILDLLDRVRAMTWRIIHPRM